MSKKKSYYYNSFSLGYKNRMSSHIVLDGTKSRNFNSEAIINNIKYNEKFNIWNNMPAGINKNNYKITDVDPAKALVDKGTPAFRNKANTIKGNRKTLECCNKSTRNTMITEIYEDTYTHCNCKRPIIKSGMQHKQIQRYLKEEKKLNDYETLLTKAKTKAKTDKTALDNAQGLYDGLADNNPDKPNALVTLNAAKATSTASNLAETKALKDRNYMQEPVKIDYAYSYREYLINKKKTGEERIMSGGKNSCIKKQDGTDCWTPKYPGGLQNYTGNGAVTSGLRITNLKLNAIRGGVKCKDANGVTHCKGVYFAGKPRWTGWIFNKNHKEINFPQLKAKHRTYSLFTGSGKLEKKIKKGTNDGSCCGGKVLFDISGCCQ